MRSSCPTCEPSARRRRVAAGLVGLGLVVCLWPAPRALAQATADRAAAMVLFPLVRVDSSTGLDTFLRLSNASASPLAVRCFLENANGHCLSDGSICSDDEGCPGSSCVPGFAVSDFQITLTAGQPVEWRAGLGLAVLPAPGNAGQIPPVTEDPFLGALRCVVVDSGSGLPPVAAGPSGDNLEGVALIERRNASAVEMARYRAVGFPSISNDGDATLEIGNEIGAEYDACPNTVSFTHLSENALEPIGATAVMGTELTLIPCSADYRTGTPMSDVVHFTVYNEFEQRLGGNQRVVGLLAKRLADLHPTVFDVGVLGTLSAYTRIQAVDGGVVGLTRRTLDGDGGTLATPAFDLIHQGVRGPQPDLLLLP